MARHIVVIGTGFGKYAAAPAYRRAGCEVTLVSARDDAGIAQALERPCDLVSIHSPPFMHLEHVQRAVASGCHVLCDKPFGRNLGEAQTMLQLAERAGVRHFLNFEFRFDAQRLALKSLLESGAIGTPQHFSYTAFLSRGRSMPHGWLFDGELGGGWIGAFASHFVDSLHWLFGDIGEVSCLSRCDVAERPDAEQGLVKSTAEDALTAWFRLDSGVTAMLDTAFAASLDQPPQITLLGSEGMIRLLPGAELQLLKPGAAAETIDCGGSGNPMADAMDRWVAAVLHSIDSGESIVPDFTTGVACARVLDQLRESASRA